MPEYLRGKRRNQYTLVTLNVNPRVYYAFYRKDYSGITGISDNDFVNLGHEAAPDGSANTLIFLRAQAPKPARVKKVINEDADENQQISVSTFCATPSLDTAQGNGWTIVKRPRGVTLKNKRSITALAELSNGVLYAFPLNKKDYEEHSGILGFKAISTINSNSDAFKLVSGSSRPRPGKASLPQENRSEFKTFFSTSQRDDLIRAGWSIDEDEFL